MFWLNVDRSGGPEACWPWTAGRFDSGYGAVQWGAKKDGGKLKGSHVVAYGLENGPVPDGKCVLHSCDNRPCCNPTHLFLGTKGDNAADAVSKDRHTRGERHGLAKLTDAAVRDIRARYVPRHPTNSGSALAKEYGVTAQLIAIVVAKKAWAHV